MRRARTRGQTLPLLVLGLVALLLMAGLLAATSRLFDRAEQAQAAADEASRAAALVAANTLSSIAQLNTAQAYIDGHLGRYVVDRTVYDTLQEFRLHPPVPAPAPYVGTGRIASRAAASRHRAAVWLARGTRWSRDLWRVSEALARTAPARCRAAAELAAARHGGSLTRYESPVRWLGPEGWDRFDAVTRARYRVTGDGHYPGWYDVRAGGPRMYSQTRECWNGDDLAHDAPRHGGYWPHQASPNGHWHDPHPHIVATPFGLLAYTHIDGHTDDGHPPAEPGVDVHHGIRICPTCVAVDIDGDDATDVTKTLAHVVARRGTADLVVRRPTRGVPPALVLGAEGPPRFSVRVRLPVRWPLRVFGSPGREVSGSSWARVGLYVPHGGEWRLDVTRPRASGWLASPENLYLTTWGARWVREAD